MAVSAHIGFLKHRRFRDLKVASLLCLIAILAYLIHDPIDGPNGGTWLGYGLGGFGAFIILLLAWFGVRKRRYAGGIGQVKGWLSVHVYLGLALVTIGTLHTGFQFGWNVHTLAYLLMLGVIASGVYGVVVYTRLPEQITEARRGLTREGMLAEIEELNRQSMTLADALSPEIHRVIVRSIESVRIGGGVIAQLFGPRAPERREFELVHQTLSARADRLNRTSRRAPDPQSTVAFIAGQVVRSETRDEQESGRIRQLLDILGRRKELVARINRDIALHARMQIWLYAHVPLTFALLTALLAHVISVFLYW